MHVHTMYTWAVNLAWPHPTKQQNVCKQIIYYTLCHEYTEVMNTNFKNYTKLDVRQFFA